jgi:hypothetical protein
MRAFRLLTAGLIGLMAACGHQSDVPPSREAAIQFLRDQGILHGSDQIDSAEWKAKNRSWLIILHSPSGATTRWWVDPTRKTMELEAVNR